MLIYTNLHVCVSYLHVAYIYSFYGLRIEEIATTILQRKLAMSGGKRNSKGIGGRKGREREEISHGSVHIPRKIRQEVSLKKMGSGSSRRGMHGFQRKRKKNRLFKLSNVSL